MLRRSLAIDLGSANTLLSCPTRGIVLSEPSIVALTVGQGTPRVVAAGHAAVCMQGRTGSRIRVVRPVRKGMVCDSDAAALMVQAFVEKAFGGLPHFRRVLISAPRDASDVERRAFRQVAESLGSGKVLLVHEPLAAAVGAGVDVLKARGRLLVDVGSGITEAVVVSMGKVVTHHALREGGDTLNERLIEHVRRVQHMRIGAEAAERLKLQAAAAAWSGSRRPLLVRGQWVDSRMPGEAAVPPAALLPLFSAMVESVAGCVESVLSKTDPHLATDVCDDGIWLSGGSLLMPGVVARLSDRLRVRVRMVSDPLTMVAVGNGHLLASESLCREAAC